jgi:hypothetical protein
MERSRRLGPFGVPEPNPRPVVSRPGKFQSGRKGVAMTSLLISVRAVIRHITVWIAVRVKRT